MAGRRWTERELRILRERYHADGCAALAKRLGRTEPAVYNAALQGGIASRKKIVVTTPAFERFLRSHNKKGRSDQEVSELWNDKHPGNTIGRSQVSRRRRELGLPANSHNERCRQRIREASQKQLKRAGLKSMGQIRATAHREFVVSRGWPAYLRVREAMIMDVLYERGPMTRRQIAEAIGINTSRPQRAWLGCTTGGPTRGSYIANLLHYGLVVRLGKLAKTGKGKGCVAYVYAIPAHIKRGSEWQKREA